MSFKKLKNECLNKDKALIISDTKKKNESDSDSIEAIRSEKNKYSKNSVIKSKILPEKQHEKNKKKADVRKIKMIVLDDEDDDDHLHVDQDYVSEKLVKDIPCDIKKKKRKVLENDDEKLDQKIKKTNHKKKIDSDSVNDHHNKQDSKSEKLDEKPQQEIKEKNHKKRKLSDNLDKENDNIEKLPEEIEENRDNRDDTDSRKLDRDLNQEAREKNCSVAKLLDEHNKKNSIPKDNIDVLRQLTVQLIHEVPEQHLLETNAGSHAPSPETIRRFKKYVELKKGTYTKEEDRIINKNWKNFCKLHNWDTQNYQPLLNWKQDSVLVVKHFQERRKFVQFLANGLPNRTLYSVNHRFRNLHADHLQSRYSFAEDEAILKYIEENSNSTNQTHVFSDLAKVLNRTRASVWRRYRILKKKGLDE